MYIYDDRISACFNFDPRDQRKRVFPPKRRNLQTDLAQHEEYCNENTECYNCAAQQSLCIWNETTNICGAECSLYEEDENCNNIREVEVENWYDYFTPC